MRAALLEDSDATFKMRSHDFFRPDATCFALMRLFRPRPARQLVPSPLSLHDSLALRAFVTACHHHLFYRLRAHQGGLRHSPRRALLMIPLPAIAADAAFDLRDDTLPSATTHKGIRARFIASFPFQRACQPPRFYQATFSRRPLARLSPGATGRLSISAP